MPHSYEQTLEQLRSSGNFRTIPAPDHSGRMMTDMSSNDYLGLATRSDLQQQFFDNDTNRSIAMTSSAARLLAGAQTQYSLLEERLSELYGGKAALLFNSGYHANTGLIPALASEPRTLIVADKLVHASIIDGIMLSKSPYKRFTHNDFDRLEQIVAKEHDSYDRILVITESIYSMDGDSADLDRLTTIKHLYPKTMLYIDEAHAIGVTGNRGLGLCRSHKDFADIDVIVGTFGKALASAGAFCITAPTLRDYAVNRARSFIFSTALPPINCAWSRFMLDTTLTMDNERRHLHTIYSMLFDALEKSSFRTPPEPSHIQPVIIGSAGGAIELSHRLSDEGFKVLPIRTPTVPPGTERLRISLSASISTERIERFIKALNSLS